MDTKNYNLKNAKKLKILLLTDRLSLGGAETHLISLYSELCARGHYVMIASSGGALANDINHVKIDLASHSPLKLIRGYFALRSLALREKFDIIHSHARLPSLIALFVSKELKIPLITTVHAKFKLDFFRRRLSFWGFRSIAVSEDLRYYLTKNYSVPVENVTVIQNGVDFSHYQTASAKKANQALTLLFLSRLDSDCSLVAEQLCSLAPKLYKRYKNIKIIIGGGGNKFKEIKAPADEINKNIGKKIISCVGEVSDVALFLAQGDVFVGVSRCAIEAIAASLPVIIAGNEGFLGRLTEENFDLASSTNFCARGEKILTKDLLFASICDALDNLDIAKNQAKRIYNKAKAAYDISNIIYKYEDVYLRAIKDFIHLQDKSAKTLLVGYYGFSNLGDDALLRSAIERAQREFGDSIGAFTSKPKLCRRNFGINCYSRVSPIKIFWRIMRCERVIFGGGTLFQDRTSRRSLIYYLCILKIAQLLKKDTLLYANGLEEIKNNKLRAMLFRSLSECSYIGVRDKFSYKLLHKFITPSPDISIVFENDLALNCTHMSISRAIFLIHNALKEKSPSFFVVCPRAHSSRFDRFELELAIRRQKNKRLAPLYILCSPEDFDLAYSLKLKYGGALLSSISFADLLAIFPFSRCVISMRYHPLLAARACSIPYVPIGSDAKIREFFT